MSRPDRTTMQGMIWNANHVLDAALDPNTKGLPRQLFQGAIGLILLNTVEVGFIFAGHVGTGIILSKGEDGKWSAPCACGLTGVGWGFLVGGALRDIVVFIYDEPTLQSISASNGMKLGGQASLVLGPVGRDLAGDLHFSGQGIGATAAFAMSRGAFAGISIEGAVVGARHAVNQAYYQNASISPTQILFEGMAQLPGEGTLMPEIYKKLDMLAEGKTAVPDEGEKSKIESARQEAEKAGVEARNTDDVEHVGVNTVSH